MGFASRAYIVRFTPHIPHGLQIDHSPAVHRGGATPLPLPFCRLGNRWGSAPPLRTEVALRPWEIIILFRRVWGCARLCKRLGQAPRGRLAAAIVSTFSATDLTPPASGVKKGFLFAKNRVFPTFINIDHTRHPTGFRPWISEGSRRLCAIWVQ